MQNQQGHGTTTGCVTFAAVFQDRLLEEPPTQNAPAADRRRYAELVERAAEVCARCPFQDGCLYQAVAEHDVAGFVAGTTQRQRNEIRRRLGVRVEPEDLDTLAGVTAPNRQVDHDEVVRLRSANPNETLENIAQRLGCSLSTVKRHLRRARVEDDDGTVRELKRIRRVTALEVAVMTLQVLALARPSSRRAA